MDSDLSVNTLTAKLDELRLQKPLPLRQQVEKPTLKYTNSEPGPIYLYQNPDLNSRNASVPGSPIRTNVAKYNVRSSLNPELSHSSSSEQYPYIPLADPYTRPVSAKDLMTVGMERTKTPPGSFHVPISSNHAGKSSQPSSLRSSVRSPSATETSRPMKLLSEAKSTTKSKHTSSSQPTTQQMTTATITSTKVISVPSSNTTIQTSKEKFEASLSKPSSASSEHGRRPPSALRRPSSSVRNPDYSPSKPYGEKAPPDEAEDFKMVSDNNKVKGKTDETLNGKITRAITNLNRVKTANEKDRPDSNQKRSSKDCAKEPSHATSKEPASASLGRRETSAKDRPSTAENPDIPSGTRTRPTSSKPANPSCGMDSRRCSVSSEFYL